MHLLKICSKEKLSTINSKVSYVVNELIAKPFQVHIQELDNQPYMRWLVSMATMEWKTIIDVFWNEDIVTTEEVLKYVCGVFEHNNIAVQNMDFYAAQQIQHKKPVDKAEVITSCYLWNYDSSEATRLLKMKEHFDMEQEQYYYDYIAFQIVNKILTPDSPKFDFFFESHVSKPEGIDEIYSKPALNGMRQHSEIFLDVSTRQLTFGRVSCYGG